MKKPFRHNDVCTAYGDDWRMMNDEYKKKDVKCKSGVASILCYEIIVFSAFVAIRVKALRLSLSNTYFILFSDYRLLNSI